AGGSGAPYVLASVTDFRNRTVSFEWSATGKILAIHRPTVNGGTATASVSYEPTRDQPLSYTDELNNTVQITLDANYLPQQITSPAGPVVQFLRNSFGEPTQVTDPA